MHCQKTWRQISSCWGMSKNGVVNRNTGHRLGPLTHISFVMMTNTKEITLVSA